MKQSISPDLEFQLPDARVAIVAARFNSEIVDGLLAGALLLLENHGVAQAAIRVVHVPGAFELPLAVQRLAQSARFDAVIALGTVIRGDTAHFEYVAGPCATGLAEVALKYDTPVGFGVLTVNNQQQAIDRSRADNDNKGAEAALAVLQMIRLLRELTADAACESAS